jgi:hypothetical protein
VDVPQTIEIATMQRGGPRAGAGRYRQRFGDCQLLKRAKVSQFDSDPSGRRSVELRHSCPSRVPRPPPRPASAPAAPSSGLADLTVALILDFASVALGRLAALVARDE